MNDWEAEKQREHQRNVAIIIVVFFGLLYLSYKFDDDPPFKKHPPVNQSPSKGLPITPTGIVTLDRIAVDRLVINRGAALLIEIAWHRTDRKPGQTQVLLQLINATTGETAVTMGPTSIRSGNSHLRLGLPSEMLPGEYQVTIRLPGDSNAPFYSAPGPTVNVL